MRAELEGLDRESLVVRAQAAGIRRARILTRPELIDELLRLDPSADDAQLKKSRGFFGRARDLVARVVERGLHLPDAADRIRTLAGGGLTLTVPRTEPQAMPTVTLAEIYAAQGHSQRAIETLKRVLDREPEHAAARALLARLTDEAYVAPPPPLPPEPEIEAETSVTDDGDDEDALDSADEPTIDMRKHAPGRQSSMPPARTALGIQGPSYGDSQDAEFHLAPASDPQPPVEGAFDDPAYAPTRELPRTAGRSYSFTPAQGDFGVDVNARTDVFETVVDHGVSRRRAAGTTASSTTTATATVTAPDTVEEDVDDCYAIPVERDQDGGRMYARWNVSFMAIGALLGARPNGRFVVRAHVVTPGWDGPNTETRDRVVDPDDGEITLRALPEPAVVRVAVGWLDGTTFVPLAHSPALEISPKRGLVLWTPKGLVPVVLDDPRSASLAKAFDRSKRAAQAHG